MSLVDFKGKTAPKVRIRYIIYGLIGLFIVFFYQPSTPYGRFTHNAKDQLTEIYNINDSVSGDYLAASFAARKFNLKQASNLFVRALSNDQENPYLLAKSFHALLLSGRSREAVAFARRHEHLNRLLIKPSILLLVDHIKQERYAEIPALADKMLGEVEHLLSIRDLLTFSLLKIWAYVGMEEYDQAFSLLEELSAADVYPMVEFYSAVINDMRGNRTAAFIHYTNSLALPTRSYRFMKAIGNFYQRAGYNNHARTLYERYQSRDDGGYMFEKELREINAGVIPPPYIDTVLKGTLEVLMDVVLVSYQMSQPEEGLAYLQMALHLDPNNAQAMMLSASAAEFFNDFEVANQYYANVTKQSVFHYNSLIHRAKNAQLLGKTNEAERLLRESTYLNPNNNLAWVELGHILRKKKSYEGAIEAYSRALLLISEYEDRHWYLFYVRGMAYERAGEWDKAVTDFTVALTLNPGQADVLNYMGYSMLIKNENIQLAHQYLQQAMEVRGFDAFIQDSMAWSYFVLGEYEKATALLEASLTQEPYNAVINDHLGDVYWQSGRKREAYFQWHRALDSNPDAELRQKLEKKIADPLGQFASAS